MIQLEEGLTVVVLLLEVHVDNTTGPDVNHLVTVDSLNLGEDTGRRHVATVLSEENGDIVGLELLGPQIVSGLLEGGLSAPRVDVVTPEIDRLLSLSAVEVVSQVVTDLSIIVGGVTNTDLSVALGLDVCLGITDRGLDEGTGVGIVSLVGDFVSSKEAQGVGELGHLVDDSGVALKEGGGPCCVITLDGVLGVGKILNNVDSGLLEKGHALFVVLCRVNGIDTDNVGA